MSTVAISRSDERRWYDWTIVDCGYYHAVIRQSVRPSVLCSSAEPAAAATDAAPRTETTNGLEREAAHKNAMTVLTAAGARLAAES